MTFSALDLPYYSRWGKRSGTTFAAEADRGGLIELLGRIHDALGFAPAAPTDAPRTDELEMMPVISAALEAGFDPEALVGMMRVSRAGAHRLERPPAIGFVDLSGYSRLTEEHGDERAAEVAPAHATSCGGSLVGTAAWR